MYTIQKIMVVACLQQDLLQMLLSIPSQHMFHGLLPPTALGQFWLLCSNKLLQTVIEYLWVFAYLSKPFSCDWL